VLLVSFYSFPSYIPIPWPGICSVLLQLYGRGPFHSTPYIIILRHSNLFQVALVSTLTLLSPLLVAEVDNAPFGWFHVRTCLVAGVGFYTVSLLSIFQLAFRSHRLFFGTHADVPYFSYTLLYRMLTIYSLSTSVPS
jgi:hypothetical protein